MLGCLFFIFNLIITVVKAVLFVLLLPLRLLFKLLKWVFVGGKK